MFKSVYKKQIFITSFILILNLFLLSANAQIMHKGIATIQMGVGFPSSMHLMGSMFKLTIDGAEDGSTYDYKYKGIVPLHMRAEYMAGDRLGIGLSANAAYGKFFFTANYLDDNENFVSKLNTYRYSSINILLRLNYHFIKRPTKFDIYFGNGIGYALTKTKLKEHLEEIALDPDEKIYTDGFSKYLNSVFTKLPFVLESVVGIKVPFTDNAGFYVELGYAKALGMIGIYSKIARPKGYRSDRWQWF